MRIPISLTLILTGLMSSPAWAKPEGTFWLPPAASTLAKDVDFTFYYIYWVSAAFLLVLMGSLGFMAVKYRQKVPGERTSPVRGNHMLEIAWSTLPGILLVVMFFLGFKTWMNGNVPPADSYNVNVYGQKWNWSFEYPDSGVESDTLIVPAGTPVRLTMTSRDVIHSFYVPDFRIKKDVVPNRYTVIWFDAPIPGEYQVYCTEYCGNGHSRMLNTVKVLEPAAFRVWMAEQKSALAASGSMSPKERGLQLFRGRGCASCHSVDGSAGVGPSLKGKFGIQESLADGSTVLIDENYVRESIMVPAAKVVAGFSPVMPSFQGQLEDEQIDDLLAYIKSLGE